MPKKHAKAKSREVEIKDQPAQPETEQWEELFRFAGFRLMALKPEQTQTRPMQPETRKRILEAWEELFKFLGFPTLMDAAKAMLETPTTEHTNKEVTSNGLVTGFLAALHLVMQRYVATQEEPTPEQLEKTLAEFRGLHYKMREMFKETATTLAKRMPHSPGGHPRSLTQEQCVEVRQEVLKLYGDRLLLRNAFQRVAQKYKVSPRTIERVWRNRPLKGELQGMTNGKADGS